MIKAAFFDIDGTIYSHAAKGIPADTLKALYELKRRGVLIFSCTGRHMLELQELGVDSLPFDGHILLDGQLCLDAERAVIGAVPIPEEDLARVIPVFQSGEIPILLVQKDHMELNCITNDVKSAQEAISSEVPPIGTWNGEPVYQLCVYGTDTEIDRIMSLMPQCKLTRWNPRSVDVFAKEGGKSAGIARMLARFGLTRQEIIAFGDGENDMEMLTYAEIGVAMGNAEDKVKACADYVTSGVDDGGIVQALKHYKLL